MSFYCEVGVYVLSRFTVLFDVVNASVGKRWQQLHYLDIYPKTL